jgi:hypothetical protein
MSKLLFASLITLASSASAQALRPPVPPGPPTHRPVFPGDCTISVRTPVLAELDAPTWHTQIYTSGAWRYVELDKKGATTLTMSGCLDDSTYKPLADELAKATWKEFYTARLCQPPPSTIEYLYLGKHVWTRTCLFENLDDVSTKAIRDLDALNTKLSTHVGPDTWKGHKP